MILTKKLRMNDDDDETKFETKLHHSYKKKRVLFHRWKITHLIKLGGITSYIEYSKSVYTADTQHLLKKLNIYLLNFLNTT